MQMYLHHILAKTKMPFSRFVTSLMIVVTRVMNCQPLVPHIRNGATLKETCVVGLKTPMISLTGQETVVVRHHG